MKENYLGPVRGVATLKVLAATPGRADLTVDSPARRSGVSRGEARMARRIGLRHAAGSGPRVLHPACLRHAQQLLARPAVVTLLPAAGRRVTDGPGLGGRSEYRTAGEVAIPAGSYGK